MAIAFPRLTVAFWIAVSVAGVFAFRSLKYSLLPDITFPVVIVNAGAPLQTAEEMEERIVRPIESRLKSLEGLDEIRASIYPGQTAITVSFRVGTRLDFAALAVERAVKELALPEMSALKVIPLNLNQTSVVTFAIDGKEKSLAELTVLSRERIVPAMEKVPGVLEAQLLGEPPVKPVAGHAPSVVRFNGTQVLALEIVKRSDANTLEVVRAVRAEVERLQVAIPGVRLTVARTQADFIREASHSTVEALLIAVALSVLVIFPFLWSWPATLISALAIPTSLLGTAIVMALCGFELDTISLLALALVIGIIIDDAIVDVENIARHLEEGGESPRHAALSATMEIGLTVAAATFTIVAVFLPVALMHGTVGQFFKPFGVTVSAAVLISLLVARTLSPLLAVYWLKPVPAHGAGAVWRAFVRWYRGGLEWSLHHPRIVLGLAAVSFAGGVALVPLIPKGLIPRLDRGEFKINFAVALPATQADPRTATAGAAFDPMATALEAAKKLEDFVRAYPQVEAVFTIVGTRQGEPNKGAMHVRLHAGRTLHTAAIEDQLRRSLPKLDGVTTSVEDIPFVDAGEQKTFEVALVGPDLAALEHAATELADRLKKLPGFADVSTTAGNTQGTRRIEHRSSQRSASVQANLSDGYSLGDATQQAAVTAREILPAGVTLQLGGDSSRVVEVFTSFGITLGLSVVCILLVLVLLFHNWVDPLVILFSLPLAVVGAVVALMVVRSEFGMISLIGVVFLFGLVNKNAILLVDYINQLRASGLGLAEAILRAGPVRLRPILMTTLATILGMMPIALGLGVGSELRAPMAVSIIGGLVTSTLLSLIVVPVVYTLLDGWRRKIRTGV